MARKQFTTQEDSSAVAPEQINAEGEIKMNDEMVNDQMTDATPPDTTPPAAGDDKDTDTRVWHTTEGVECSKSAFIRDQFLVANLSRKQIAENFDIPYRTVYGATVNLVNAAEATARGRGQTFSKIHVTDAGIIVTTKEDKVFFNNVEQPEGTEMPETIEVDRNAFIKAQIAGGADRGDIAKALDLSYGVIYNLTKEAEGTRQKYDITLEDGTVIGRSEYIRQLVAEGMSKGEVAKKLNVEYSVVWQATKQLKSVEEKFNDTIKDLEAFVDAVVAPEAFATLIASLKAVELKKEDAETVTPATQA